jgi:hypothetical protein
MKHTDKLYSILEEVWDLLQRGHQDPTSRIRTPVLATLGLNGQANARTVVLRHVEPEGRKLFTNTDSRSPKYLELIANPQGTFIFFDAETEIQLRIYTEICIHQNNELAYRAWNELSLPGRQIYKTLASPGRPAPKPTSGLPTPQETRIPKNRDHNAGYENFIVLEATAKHLDWLHSSKHGHCRAAFTWGADDVLHTSWLFP